MDLVIVDQSAKAAKFYLPAGFYARVFAVPHSKAMYAFSVLG